VRVLVSLDGHGRVEPRAGGLVLLWCAEPPPAPRRWSALLSGVSMDHVVRFLLERGVDPSTFTEE
jgi:hypothetical protein